MLLLNQTLTSSEKQAVLQVSERFADDLYLAYYDENSRGDALSEPFLMGKQAVPANESQWDPDTPLGKWQRRHFHVSWRD